MSAGDLQVRHLVDARIYESEEEAIQDALRCLMRSRPEVRIRLAVYRYVTEGLSLAKAAGLAGVSWAQMREILLEQGVELRLGPETVEQALEEAEAAQWQR